MTTNLSKIINKKVIIPITKSEHDSFINLLESDEASKISELKITDIPDGSIAFTLDFNDVSNRRGGESRMFKKLSAYLEPENSDGINKSCDLVIVTQGNDEEKKLKIVVLDLKSDKAGARGETQVENSVLFIKYLLSILEFHYDEKHSNVVFFKRLITTSAVKNAIGKQGRDQSLTHKISAKVSNKKSNINYSRLIV